jgi:hypothetical protein
LGNSKSQNVKQLSTAKNMRNLISAILVLMTFACGTERTVTTDTKPKSTIVFGKLIIEPGEALINSKTLIHSSEQRRGTSSVWLDKNGFFYMKLPLGTSFISLIESQKEMGFILTKTDSFISIIVPSLDNVYYIGDISFTWTPSRTDQRQSEEALGVVIKGNKRGEYFIVSVKETDSTLDYFSQKFPNNKKPIVKQLATVGQKPGID